MPLPPNWPQSYGVSCLTARCMRVRILGFSAPPCSRAVTRAPAPLIFLSLLLLVTIMGGIVWTHSRDTKSARVPPARSVAILPFVDLSEKRDQEYFSDGLSEELIDQLTNVPDLVVPARTSSFYFKGKQSTISDIARTLNVALRQKLGLPTV